jgi:hypothetical protein
MKNHYVYYSYEEWGRGYIGSRSCDCLPEEDTDYFGSFTDLSFNPTQKIILCDDYDTREQANKDEVTLHEFFDVAKNPYFANRAKQTSEKFDTTGLTCWYNPVKGEEVMSVECPGPGFTQGRKPMSEQHRENIVKALTGKPPSEKQLKQLKEARTFINFNAMLPEMKERGRVMGEKNKGKISITDGVVSTMITEGEKIPEGWRRGDAGGKRKGAIKASFLIWEDPDHPEIGRHNAGNLVKRQKSLGLPHSKENRRQVNGN